MEWIPELLFVCVANFPLTASTLNLMLLTTIFYISYQLRTLGGQFVPFSM